MTEDGWEEVHIWHLGDHNEVFVSYRDAEREGSIASVSMRLEGSIGPMALLRKERMLVRSELMRVQFDCVTHARRLFSSRQTTIEVFRRSLETAYLTGIDNEGSGAPGRS